LLGLSPSSFTQEQPTAIRQRTELLVVEHAWGEEVEKEMSEGAVTICNRGDP
jgi:hypothetical protein